MLKLMRFVVLLWLDGKDDPSRYCKLWLDEGKSATELGVSCTLRGLGFPLLFVYDYSVDF